MKKKYENASKIITGRRQDGFSLIEVMIIIAILGTLSAVAVPNILQYRDNARLRATAADMLALFRKAQVSAVKSHYNTCIDFNTAGSVTVFLDNGAGGLDNNSIQDAGEPTLQQFSIPEGCSVPLAQITFGGNKAGFNSRGLPTKTGKVFIYSTSSGSPAQYRVSVAFTGHSTLEVSTDGGTTWE